MELVRKQRVVVLGGGHAGVHAAARLLKLRQRHEQIEVVLVNHDNAEVWHGFMPQIVGGQVEPRHALVSLRSILPGVILYSYEISRIDLEQRQVILDRGDEKDQIVLDYDYLVLALGSVTNLSRFPGLLEHGLQTKTIGDVFHLRSHLIDMLEQAAVEQDPDERKRLLTFVVAGAGFAGVEIGAQANTLIRSSLRFYPQLQESEIKFVIVNSSTRLLPATGERLANRAARYMRRKGIELRLGVRISGATTNAALLSNGDRIPTRTLIVTVGVGPNPIISSLPLQLKHGRIETDEYCRVLGQDKVYAVGDNAAIPNPKTGEPCPPTAIYAFTQGERAADNILAEIRNQAPKKYAFKNVGEVALLSTNYGVAELYGIPMSGLPAAIAWRVVFLSLIPTWYRRFTLLMDWFTAVVFPPDISQLRISRSDTIIPLRFGAGDVIIREGDPANRFYIINDGEVEVLRETAGGGEEVIDHLGPGQYFGEVALLHNVKRNATVRAIGDTKILSIARQDFSTLVKNMPGLRDTLHQSVRNGPPTQADGEA